MGVLVGCVGCVCQVGVLVWHVRWVSDGCVSWVCQVSVSGGCVRWVCQMGVSGGCVRWVCQMDVSACEIVLCPPLPLATERQSTLVCSSSW